MELQFPASKIQYSVVQFKTNQMEHYVAHGRECTYAKLNSESSSSRVMFPTNGLSARAENQPVSKCQNQLHTP